MSLIRLLANTVIVTAGKIIEKQPFLAISFQGSRIDSQTLHPLLRPFGLSGRDLVRVMMGFGCNVPAVISTRSCSGCTRQTCISAIAFGSACSYQIAAIGFSALLAWGGILIGL